MKKIFLAALTIAGFAIAGQAQTTPTRTQPATKKATTTRTNTGSSIGSGTITGTMTDSTSANTSGTINNTTGSNGWNADTTRPRVGTMGSDSVKTNSGKWADSTMAGADTSTKGMMHTPGMKHNTGAGQGMKKKIKQSKMKAASAPADSTNGGLK